MPTGSQTDSAEGSTTPRTSLGSARQQRSEPVVQVVEDVAIREALEGAGGEQVRPGIDARPLPTSQIESPCNASHAAPPIHSNRTETRRSRVVPEHQGRCVPVLAMLANHPCQIEVEDHVAPEDHAGVAFSQEARDSADCTSGVEQLRLVGEVKLHMGRTPALGGGDQGLGKMVEVDHHLVDASPGEECQGIGDHGDPAHRDRRLRPMLGEGVKAGAEARCDDHPAHADSGSAWTRSASRARLGSRQATRAAAPRRARTVLDR